MSRSLPIFLLLTPASALAQSRQDVSPSIEELLRRIEVLEQGEVDYGPIDLSGGEVEVLPVSESDHVLARPWYENVTITGFAAATYLDTGGRGTRPDGSFLVKESSLFLDVDVWNNLSFFSEVQLNRLGTDDAVVDGTDKLGVRTGEVHLHFRDVFGSGGEHPIGIKVGRVDIPFGEEYLWQDSTDNPLISASTSFLYGFDEGVVAYGAAGPVGWIASLTDGTYDRNFDDDPSKAVSAKIYGDATDEIYVSASYLKNGDSAKSGIKISGQHFVPIGMYGVSTLGSSPSSKIDAALWEADAIWRPNEDFDLSLFYGGATANDDADAFDRDFRWFMVQPRWDLSEDVFAVLRYSQVGTTDSDEGYHFDGKIIADGHAEIGYDASRLQRLSVGLGWRMNARTLFKLEVGKDRFDVIDASPLDAENDERLFFGAELVVSF